MTEIPTLRLADAGRDRLAERLSALDSPYEDIEKYLLSLYPLFAELPERLLGALFAFRRDPAVAGVMRLGNFPTDPELPPTPTNGRRSPLKRTFVSEGCLLGIAQILGQPLGYAVEKDGELIQNLAPVKSEAASTSSESSKIDLGFHTDLDFDPDNPEGPYNITNGDYIVLAGLRADPRGDARTTYVEGRDLCARLSAEELDTLRSPSFSFQAAYTFSGDQRPWSKPTPIVQGPEDCPEVTIELACGVRAVTPEARRALERLAAVCNDPEVGRSAVLGAGDLLLIDNRKGAHARSAFAATFDGKDRWLQRIYVRRSLWELRPSQGAGRVF